MHQTVNLRHMCISLGAEGMKANLVPLVQLIGHAHKYVLLLLSLSYLVLSMSTYVQDQDKPANSLQV